jgi:N utilization substance protein B
MRRRSRELAMQGLYQWHLARKDAVTIAAELAETEGFDKSDVAYFKTLLNGAIDHSSELEALIAPHLDRPVSELSPIERSILLLGGYELKQELEVPYRVIINEAVELAKIYGGTDGHKFVNGVLDKLAPKLRELEVGDRKDGAKRS